VVDLLPSGKPCRQIAREVGISPDTVSRIAKANGFRFGQQAAAHAREVRSAYCAAWRADFAARLAEDAERLRSQLFTATEQWSFGGKDNLFSHETTDEPSPQQKRDLMQSISTAIRTVLDIDRHDRQTDADSAVDQFLARLKDGAQ
jgi:hypothetical protein